MGNLVVISGAGLSVESGVKAFRTDTASGRAIWDEYDLDIVCNLGAFQYGYDMRGKLERDKNPYYLTHEFYNKRRQELQTVGPNLAHCRIAEWYKRFPMQVENLTTNVDDLLERAGIDFGIMHIHGYLPEVMVNDQPQFNREHVGSTKINVGYSAVDPDDYAWAKPAITFFGEVSPAYQPLQNRLFQLDKEDLVVIVGVSNQVINFVGELCTGSKWGGYNVVVINPKPASMSEVYLAEDTGAKYYMQPAGEVFSSNSFIDLVESHLERNFEEEE